MGVLGESKNSWKSVTKEGEVNIGLPSLSPTNRIAYPSTAKRESINIKDLDHLTSCSNDPEPKNLFKNINVSLQTSAINTPDPAAL